MEALANRVNNRFNELEKEVERHYKAAETVVKTASNNRNGLVPAVDKFNVEGAALVNEMFGLKEALYQYLVGAMSQHKTPPSGAKTIKKAMDGLDTLILGVTDLQKIVMEKIM